MLVYQRVSLGGFWIANFRMIPYDSHLGDAISPAELQMSAKVGNLGSVLIRFSNYETTINK
jgi:hypothetical protein